MLITDNRKVICAGCAVKYPIAETSFYRNKRFCGKPQCQDIINLKIKHSNFKKAKRKKEKGTFRNGVPFELRDYIKSRDDFTCRHCMNSFDTTMLQVHHITPVSAGGNDDPKNLILLCYSCHTRVHQQGWGSYTTKFFDYTSLAEV